MKNAYRGPRQVVIGWDAGCWAYLEPVLNRGLLPNLQQIMQEGCYGALRSTLPPMTPVAWTTALTGCNPGKHGIFNWWCPDKDGTIIPYDGSSVRVPTLLQLLGGAGFKVGAIDVPMTSPPPPVNGFVLGGLGDPTAKSPGLGGVYPASLGEFLHARHADFFRFNPRGFVDAASNEDLLSRWAKHESLRRDVVGTLVTEYEPDLLWVHCHVGDYFGHRVSADSEVLAGAYGVIDDMIDACRQLMDPSGSILVMSDHGQAEIESFVLVQNWLAQKGLLHFQSVIPEERFGNALIELLRRGGVSVPAEVVEPVVSSAANAYYGLPDPVREDVSRLVDRIVPGALKDHGNIDWSRTKAYCCEFYGLIRINLRGREAQGTVDPADYDELVEHICRELSELDDPQTGRRVGIRAHRAHDVYSGEAMAHAPDIVCEQTDHTYYLCPIHALHLGEGASVVPIDQGRINRDFHFLDQHMCGDHSQEGFFALAGADIVARGQQASLHLTDVAPTLLHYFGLEPPAYMDGTAQKHLLRVIAANQSRESAPQALIQELRALGYKL